MNVLSFFGGLSSTVYEYLAVALVVIALGAYVYHLGGEAPRAELEQERAAVVAAKKIHDAEDAKKAAESTMLIAKKDRENEKSVAAIGAGYESYIAGLRRDAASRADKRSQPAVVASGVCQDAAGDNLVSSAVEKYRLAVRAAHDDYRADVAGILESAEKQTAALINLQETLAGIKQINKE